MMIGGARPGCRTTPVVADDRAAAGARPIGPRGDASEQQTAWKGIGHHEIGEECRWPGIADRDGVVEDLAGADRSGDVVDLVDGQACLTNDLGRLASDVVGDRAADRNAGLAHARRVFDSVDVGDVGVGAAGGISSSMHRDNDDDSRICDLESRRVERARHTWPRLVQPAGSGRTNSKPTGRRSVTVTTSLARASRGPRLSTVMV